MMQFRGIRALAAALALGLAAPAAARGQGHPVEDAGAAQAPEDTPGPLAASLGKVVIPYAVIAGGLRFERLFLREGQTRQSRSPTLALSRMGLRGHVGEFITFRSEIEASLGGSLGYGASVWEGQAQLTVRDQWVQYKRCGVAVALGRVTDDATINFYSDHVADLLLADFYTRWPIIFSGGDRGTGILATFDLRPGLRAGVTVHSTNPTGLTGSYQVGGALFPFTRPFGLAAAQVGRSADGSPDHSLHMYFGTASLVYTSELVDIKTAAQGYVLDTQMATSEDERIRGYNGRLNIRLKSPDNRLATWLNVSRNENEMLDPMDATVKLADTYSVYTVSGGVDYNYDGGNGVGAQYAMTRQYEQAEPLVEHYVNVGTTYWIEPGTLSLGARLGYYVLDNNQSENTGHASLFVTGRLLL